MRTEGLEIKVSVNTAEFHENLKKLKSESRKLGTDLKEINRDLKFDPNNIELLNRKMKVLRDRMDNAKSKQAELNAEIKRMEQAGKIDTDEYIKLRNELISVKNAYDRDAQALEKMTSEATKADKSLDQLRNSSKVLTSDLKKLDRALELDPDNIDLIDQKMKLLKQTTAENKRRQAELNQELSRMKEAGNIDTRRYTKLTNELVKISKETEKADKEFEQLSRRKIELNTASVETNLSRLTNRIQEVGRKASQMAQRIKTSLATTGKTLQATGDKITGIGSKFTPITAGIVGLGGASVKLASDMNESMNKVDVAFGKSANEVKKFSDTSLKEFGIAKGTALDMSATFGDMGTSMGLTQAQASKMSTSLVGLSGDLSSFKNIGLEEASQALTGVFTGETESLKRLGIVMTDTNVKTFALKNGFKGNWEQASQNEKVMYRYKYILDATKNSQGDFARTNGGLANQSRMLGENLKQLGATIGAILAPAVNRVVTVLNAVLAKFQQLPQGVQTAIIAFAGVAAAIGPVMFLVGGVVKAFGLLATVLSASMSPIGLVVGAIAMLGVGLSQLTAKQIGLQGSSNALSAIWNQVLMPAIQRVSQWIQTQVVPALQQMWQWVQTYIIPVFTSFAQMVMTSVVPVLIDLWNMIQTNVVPVFKKLADFIFGKVIPTLSDLWQWFMSKIIPVLMNTVRTIISNLQPAFNVAKDVINRVIDIVSQLWGWFEKNLLPILKDIAEFIAGVFSTKLSNLSKLFGTVGKAVGDFINNGLKWLQDTCDSVGDAFEWLGDKISAITGIFNTVKKGLSDGFQWISNKVNDAKKWLSKVNPFDAGGFGNIQAQYQFASAGYGADYGGYGDINVNFNLTNNGENISESTFRSYGKTIVDIVDEEFYRRGRR